MNMGQKLALEEAVEWINTNYQPIAIIATGSIIRGNGNANSDFDIFVIHNDTYRQRVQKFFNNVPCEIFINNIQHIQGYFEDELKSNKPVSANMLATGKVLMGADNNHISELIEQAKQYATRAIVLSNAQLNARKYTLVTFLEDATDVIDADTATAQLLLNRIVEQIIEYVFALHQQPLPRIKDRLKILHDIDANTAISISAYYGSKDVMEQYKLIYALVLRLTGHTSFYEWESSKD